MRSFIASDFRAPSHALSTTNRVSPRTNRDQRAFVHQMRSDRVGCEQSIDTRRLLGCTPKISQVRIDERHQKKLAGRSPRAQARHRTGPITIRKAEGRKPVVALWGVWAGARASNMRDRLAAVQVAVGNRRRGARDLAERASGCPRRRHAPQPRALVNARRVVRAREPAGRCVVNAGRAAPRGARSRKSPSNRHRVRPACIAAYAAPRGAGPRSPANRHRFGLRPGRRLRIGPRVSRPHVGLPRSNNAT